MARCGCGSTLATGAAMEGSDCIAVSGAGTALSPFVVETIISGVSDNLVECSGTGLYARAPVQSRGDASMLVEEGSGLGDYDFSVVIDPATTNLLELTSAGLYARAPIQAAADASIEVTDGTGLGDYLIGVQLDPDDDNTLQLTDDGLFSRAPAQSAADASMIVTADTGGGAGDYTYAAQLDPDDLNQLELTDDGLMVPLFANVQMVGAGAGVGVGGSPPGPEEERVWQVQWDSVVGISDVNGHVHVPFPRAFTGGVVAPVWCIGDRPLPETIMTMDAASVDESGFDVVVEQPWGTPIAGGAFRINFSVMGWDTP